MDTVCNLLWYNYITVMVDSSLVPRPEEEEKGPGFSRLRMRLIAVEFHHLRILLIYFCMLVTPESTLNIILSKHGMQETHWIVSIQQPI